MEPKEMKVWTVNPGQEDMEVYRNQVEWMKRYRQGFEKEDEVSFEHFSNNTIKTFVQVPVARLSDLYSDLQFLFNFDGEGSNNVG